MAYTREQLIEKVGCASENMSLFYKQSFINYKGTTADTSEYYTEVICEWLLNNINKLDEIKAIPREKCYKAKTHDGIPANPDSTRTEELIAMAMFRQSEIPGLGKIVDYQTPLKNHRDDKADKIDLLSYDGKTLRILELKEPDSTETMLRCVLEGYTYLKTADIPKVLHDFQLPEDTAVVACPFVFYDGLQHKEMSKNLPNMRRLMALLNCYPLYIKETDNGYIVV